ncbi:hypothetical protein ACLOJK_019557 [Asimina triloba]
MSTKFGASSEHRNSALHLSEQAAGGPIAGGLPIGRSRPTKTMATTNSLDLHHRQSSSAIIKPPEQWQPWRPTKRHLLRRAEQKWQVASTATFSSARSTVNRADDQGRPWAMSFRFGNRPWPPVTSSKGPPNPGNGVRLATHLHEIGRRQRTRQQRAV